MSGSAQALWCLLLAVPIALVMWRRYRAGRRTLALLGGRWREGRFLNTFLVKWFFSALAFLLFFVLSVLALADLSWGRYPVSERYLGTDVAIALDVSRSMLAEDVFPSRLQRAESVAKGLLDRARQDRFCVAIFKGAGVPVIPLTEDTQEISAFLDAAGPGLISVPGTDIEKGLDAAIDSLEAVKDANRKIILLFTDGGSLSGTPETAARRAMGLSIQIYPIASGTESGGPIPLGAGRYVTDRSGERVITRLEEPVLDRIAAMSGGEVYSLDDPLLLTKLTELADRSRGSGIGGAFRFEARDQYGGLLLAALVCLAIFIGIRGVRWKDTP